MKLSRPIIAVIIVAVLVIAGAAIAYTALNNQEEAGENDVRIGYLTGDLHQLSRVVANSDEAGGGTSLFEQYGIDAKFPNPAGYAAGPNVMQAFSAGDIDAAWLGAPPVILNVVNSGVDVKIVAAANNEGSSLIAKDPNIQSLADLRGKIVGTPGPGSIQQVWLQSITQAAGIQLAPAGTGGDAGNTIYWKKIAPVDQKANLENGQIDAALGWEPYGSDSILADTAHVILWSGNATGWDDHPCCVLVVATSFAEAHADLVDKLVAAHIHANEWIADAQANRDGANFSILKRIAGEFSQRDAGVVESALNNTVFTYVMDDTFKSRLVGFTDEFMALDPPLFTEAKLNERGYSSSTDLINKLVDTQYLERAADIQPES